MRDELARQPVETIEVEVLPPERKSPGAEALPRLIALVMDSLFKLPGTTMRLGLNPFLDLIPVVGDGAAAVVSALTLFVAARHRVPRVVMARMGLNILLNAAVGVIPGVGEVFAFWFRPSHRNYLLLQKHLNEKGQRREASTHGDWLFVLALAGGVLLVFGMCIAFGAFLFYALWRALFSI